MEDVKITELPSKRWKEYKLLRLGALKSDPGAFGQSYEKSVKDSDEKWKERLELSQKRDGWLFLFAKFRGELIGMMGARFDSGSRNIAKIVAAYVNKDFRRKGIADKLLVKLLKELSQITGIEKVRVMVNRLQIPAVKLYKKENFKFLSSKKMIMGDKKEYDIDTYEQDFR